MRDFRVKYVSTLLVTGLAIMCCPLVSHAQTDVLIDSTVNSADGSSQIGGGPIYASFSTDGAPVHLTDVQLVLDSPTSPSDTTTVSLYSDYSTSPDALIATLGTLSDATVGSTPAVYDIPVGPIIHLDPKTRYWIRLDDGPTGDVNWDYSYSYAGVGVSTEYYSQDGTVESNVLGGPFLMKISTSVDPSPEPGPLALLSGVGVAGFGTVLRRRRRK